MLKKIFKLQRGSTIIELLIAVMVVGLIITAIANAVTYSIKNTGESSYRQVSTILGQEVIEFVRGEKNRLGIVNLKNNLIATDYCFNDIPGNLDTTPSFGACGEAETFTFSGAGTSFKRNLVVSSGGSGTRVPKDPYYVNLEVTVSWVDGSETREVILIQEYKQDSGFTN